MRVSAGAAPLLGAFLFAAVVAAHAQEAFTRRTVNVRAGPDTSYPTVAPLGAGASVEVMGCLDDWSWCDVASPITAAGSTRPISPTCIRLSSALLFVCLQLRHPDHLVFARVVLGSVLSRQAVVWAP